MYGVLILKSIYSSHSTWPINGEQSIGHGSERRKGALIRGQVSPRIHHELALQPNTQFRPRLPCSLPIRLRDRVCQDNNSFRGVKLLRSANGRNPRTCRPEPDWYQSRLPWFLRWDLPLSLSNISPIFSFTTKIKNPNKGKASRYGAVR